MQYQNTTQNSAETKKIAADFAKKIISVKHARALVVALEGDLGAGKTTFVQGFARALGITENVLSPTFVLMKVYTLPAKCRPLRHLIHIDCYRLDSPKDILHLGFRELLKDKDAVILIEWADRIRTLIPKDSIWVTFEHGRLSSNRTLRFKMQDLRF